MPNQKKEAWKSDSIDGALLYILFQDQIEHPDSFAAASIFHHPLLPYKGKYDGRNFRGYCQTAANKFKKFREFGTGLTDSFRKHIVEAREVYADVLKKLKEEADDDSFRPDGEEDEDYNPEDYEEEELSLNEQIQNARLDARHERSMPAAATSTRGSASTRTGTRTSNRSSTRASSTTTETTSAKKLTIQDGALSEQGQDLLSHRNDW